MSGGIHQLYGSFLVIPRWAPVRSRRDVSAQLHGRGAQGTVNHVTAQTNDEVTVTSAFVGAAGYAHGAASADPSARPRCLTGATRFQAGVFVGIIFVLLPMFPGLMRGAVGETGRRCDSPPPCHKHRDPEFCSTPCSLGLGSAAVARDGEESDDDDAGDGACRVAIFLTRSAPHTRFHGAASSRSRLYQCARLSWACRIDRIVDARPWAAVL